MGCIFSSPVIFSVGCLNHNNGGLIALCLLTGEILIHSSGGEHCNHVRLFATLWTVAHQTPPSMGFSRQEYWNGLPFPSPGESSQPRDRTHVSRIAGRRFNL